MITLPRLAMTLFVSLMSLSVQAQVVLGAVVMHGKGGSPNSNVAELADYLRERGVKVENLEMPWSGRRNYDVDTDAAAAEVNAALDRLKAAGTQKRFVLGHSQGGVFALYFASIYTIDGVVAMAPGGSVDGKVYQEQLGDVLAIAKALVAEGKGQADARLADYEGSKGVYPLISKPAVYLSWFDPAGAMNVNHSLQSMPASRPVLYIAPTNDYTGLRSGARERFAQLPVNPASMFYEPSATHKSAPTVAAPAILSWMQKLAN